MLMKLFIASALAYVNVQQLGPIAIRHNFYQIRRSSASMMMSFTTTSSSSVDTARPYHPPAWTEGVLNNVPAHGRLHLANLPTPIHRVGTTKKEVGSDDDTILSRLKQLNITLYIKRDDATGGIELGGNKVRKLEFLLADALAGECDSVVTIGGEQSNHCRATAAARYVLPRWRLYSF